ncbi:MAG: DnaJ domain-containing protein [Fusobacteria bacterium]|nr:DnaJ domain-containing protein [Fusobacteriota bacterium]
MIKKYHEAIKTLDLNNKFTIKTLKEHYKEKIKENHPDLSKNTADGKTIQNIKEAYELLLDYIEHYEFSFNESDIKLKPEDYIKQKFENEWKI